jgi:S1-C subfamily serine protease
MKRAAIYSSSRSTRTASRARGLPQGRESQGHSEHIPVAPHKRFSLRSWAERHARVFKAGGVLVLIAALAAPWLAPRGLSQAQIDGRIEQALQARGAPPGAAEAYEKILPSVVHVRGLAGPSGDTEDGKAHPTQEGNVGTGVVIVDTGIVLTNLHVVQGATRVRITFHDGTEADARVTGVRPEHDLAVLQASELPDDLIPATIRSTGGLRSGDAVVAVGFPFGIGPSATAGVISGLKREYRSPKGERILTNLIQFDAAVNPGNSGGPLVTMEGEVVGIVTGLLNPTEQRVFVGVGFAVPIENAAAAAGLTPF